MMFVVGGVAAQDEPKDPRPDVLLLENAGATEPGCDSPSSVAQAACMTRRAEKADRWLTATLKSCLAQAVENDRLKKESFVGWAVKDYAISLQRSHSAFERYRMEASEAAYDSAYPGMLAAARYWSMHFQLTVERATMLVALPIGSRPLTEIDLTRADWCD